MEELKKKCYLLVIFKNAQTNKAVTALYRVGQKMWYKKGRGTNVNVASTERRC